MVTMDMVSLLPVLGLERCRRDGDALAADVVENVHLVGERPAREHLEHAEGFLQAVAGRATLHHPLDLVALDPHRDLIRGRGAPCRDWPRRSRRWRRRRRPTWWRTRT